MDSVFDSDSKGCRFDSCRARHYTGIGDLAQLEEHNAGSVGVEGSSPFSSTIWSFLGIPKGYFFIYF